MFEEKDEVDRRVEWMTWKSVDIVKGFMILSGVVHFLKKRNSTTSLWFLLSCRFNFFLRSQNCLASSREHSNHFLWFSASNPLNTSVHSSVISFLNCAPFFFSFSQRCDKPAQFTHCIKVKKRDPKGTWSIFFSWWTTSWMNSVASVPSCCEYGWWERGRGACGSE